MDIKEIQNLIKFVARSGAAEVNLETENFKINIKTDAAYKAEHPVQQVYSMPQMPVQQPQVSARPHLPRHLLRPLPLKRIPVVM